MSVFAFRRGFNDSGEVASLQTAEKLVSLHVSTLKYNTASKDAD
ncbi:MAG: hypothetical protein P8J37_19825 [Fuerstiella sp.]|nr:hypothetical protein [Fuerstiella sp.]